MSDQDAATVSLTRFDAPAQWTVVGTLTQPLWARVVAQLEVPELWPGGGSTQYAQARLPGWSFASYVDNARVASEDPELAARATAERVVKVHGLFVSYQDDPTVDADHLLTWWGRWRFAAYTTAFHEVEKAGRPAGPRWVVMLPLARPVSVVEAQLLGQWATHPRRGAGLIHEHTADLWRFWYLPAVAPGGYRHVVNEGELLDPQTCARDIVSWNASDERRLARELLKHSAVQELLPDLLHERPSVWRGSHVEAEPLGDVDVVEPAIKQTSLELAAGSVTVLTGPQAGAVALQVAVESAESGGDVLVASASRSRRELLAQMVALRVPNTTAHDWSAGVASRPGARECLEKLAARWTGMRVHVPYTESRDARGLRDAARAAVSLADDRPVVVVIDGIEGWEPTQPRAVAVRSLLSTVQDLRSDGRVAVVLACPDDVPALQAQRLAVRVDDEEVELVGSGRTTRFRWDAVRSRVDALQR